MIAFLKGKIVDIYENRVVMEVGGIGYNVFVTGRDAQNYLRTGIVTTLYTYLQVREDAMQLYGFGTKDDLEVFRLLLGVNGVGPKAALGILTALTANDLKFAVLSQDAKAIAKAPGIGSKTAQKMILELKDKFRLEDAFEEKLESRESLHVSGDLIVNEAVEALAALGYSASEALKAVRAAAAEGGEMTTEELLKAALRKMTF